MSRFYSSLFFRFAQRHYKNYLKPVSPLRNYSFSSISCHLGFWSKPISITSRIRSTHASVALLKIPQCYVHSHINVNCRTLCSKASSNVISTTIDTKNCKDSSDPSSSSGQKPKSNLKKYLIYGFVIIYGGLACGVLYNWGQPYIDEDGLEVEDEFSHLPPLEQFFKRLADRMYIFKEYFRKPSSNRLLPDPLPVGQPKYTLVLELTHVLLHPEWTYQTGWRFKKRPNVDHFFEQLSSSNLFEIVVFTTQLGMNMSPIVEVLNKNNVIKYTLYRDATEFINGEHVKNLNCLNRQLSKVIVVDWSSQSLQLHPENSLILPKWSGDDEDNTLLELATFLKNLAEKEPEDVRNILQHYKKYENPIDNFRETQRRLPLTPETPSA